MMFRELRKSIQSEETQLLLLEYHDPFASKVKGFTTKDTKVREGKTTDSC